MKNQNKSFYQFITTQFSTHKTLNNSNKKPEKKNQITKLAKISSILSPVLPRFFKENLEKLKFHQKKGKKHTENTNKDR